MQNQPLVEIHVPCYNEERNLPQLIEALERQTYKNLFVILHDNNSTDGTSRIAQAQSEKYPKKYRHIRYPRKASPFGQGHRIAKFAHGADFVSMRSANDLIGETYFEATMDLMLSQPDVAVTYSHGYLVYSDEMDKGYRSNNEVINTFGMDRVARALHVAARYTQPFSLWGVYRQNVFASLQHIACYGADHVWICEAALKGGILPTESLADFRIVKRANDTSNSKALLDIYNFWDSHHPLRTQGVRRESIFMDPDIELPLTSMLKGHLKMICGAAITEEEKLELTEKLPQLLIQRFRPFFDFEHANFINSIDKRVNQILKIHLSNISRAFPLRAIDSELAVIGAISPNYIDQVKFYRAKIFGIVNS